jgi:hypothetical protein
MGTDNRRTLTFRFADHGNIDGVDFHTDCAPRLAFAWFPGF